MALTTPEMAAFVGAAAWIPHLIYLGMKYFSKPHIIIMPDKIVEIGYSYLGPIFNLRLAISTSNKDVLLNDFYIKLVHEDGETRTLTWRETIETLSQTKDDNGIGQVISKQENGIAIKVKQDILADKVFRFREKEYDNKIQPKRRIAQEHQSYLSSLKTDYHGDLMQSQEIHNLINKQKSHFWWKSGNYTATIFTNCLNEKINFNILSYKFTLEQQQIEKLKENLNILYKQIEYDLNHSLPDFNEKEPLYNWEYSDFIKS